MKGLWFLLGVVCLLNIEFASGAVCYDTVAKQAREYTTGSYSCGWWGWSRCYTSTVTTKLIYDRVPRCCTGSYGHVENNCPGVCPYSSAQRSSACPQNSICRDYQCDQSGIDTSNMPSQEVLTFIENDDTERPLWTVNATCFVQYACACGSSSCACSKTVPCTQCTVSSTDGIADVRNGVDIYRKKCPNPKCRECRKHPGCLDHNVSYNVSVECRASGYTDGDLVRQTLSLTVEEAPKAVIEIPKEADGILKLDTNAEIGDVLLTLNITVPHSEANIAYSLSGPNSSKTGNPLFVFDNKSMQIKVNSDLSQEPGGLYTLELCVHLRRQDECVELGVEIVRITTTQPTTRKTTAEPEEEYICDAQIAWKAVPFMDWWCNLICGPIPDTCPYLDTHCRCTLITNERLTCRAGGIFTTTEYTKKHMDVWCDLNCNYGVHSNCPSNTSLPGYCICDTPLK